MTARGLWSEFFPQITAANRGIGSDTTLGLLDRLDSVVDQSPETIVCMIGVNDLAQGATSEETSERTAEIIDELHRELPDSRLILVSVLPAASVDDNLIAALNGHNEKVCGERPWLEYLDIHDR